MKNVLKNAILYTSDIMGGFLVVTLVTGVTLLTVQSGLIATAIIANHLEKN